MGILWNTGLQQQTQAVQLAYRKQMGSAGGMRKRRTGKRKKAAPKRKARSKVKRVAKMAKRLVKGSKAAKAYMAKIRRKRA